MLSPSQVDEFHRRGCLVIPAAFDESEVAEMRREADFVLELIVNSSCYHRRPSGRLDPCRRTDGGHMVRKIQPVIDLSLPLAAASNDDRLLGPMRDLMGDEPVLMEEKLNYKQPLSEPLPDDVFDPSRESSRFPIHNDWAYYRAQDYPQAILSSAIFLDECTPGNGPIRIWPGTHLEHLEHQDVPGLGLQVLPGSVDFDGGEPVVGPPGTVVVFHSLLVHNSEPNPTEAPRRVMIYSHYPAKAAMGFDVRNGPNRLRQSPFEIAYVRAKAEGRFEDRFSVTGAVKET